MVEAGLIGGAGRGQGRKPKARTAGESVAELAAQEAPAIRRAYSAGLRSSNPRTRILAADRLLAAEQAELKRRAGNESNWLPSDDEIQRMSSTDLNAALELAVECAPDVVLMAVRELSLLPLPVDSVAVES
jgi:hypothetical protein